MLETSRASSGVSWPMLVFLAKARPSINQYSRSPPALGTTTSGLKRRSASSMYSHVRSVSTTWASASITAMLAPPSPGLTAQSIHTAPLPYHAQHGRGSPDFDPDRREEPLCSGVTNAARLLAPVDLIPRLQILDLTRRLGERR